MERSRLYSAKSIVVAVILSMAVSASTVYMWQHSIYQEKLSQLSRERAVNKTENLGGISMLIIPPYDARFYSKESVDNRFLPTPADMPIEQKLSSVAHELSKHLFDGLPIEVKTRSYPDGSLTAIVDLRELSGNPTDPSWARGFFQGSTGGGCTEATLLAAFLQPEYNDPWVNAVEFFYEGKPWKTWDHIELSGRITRKDARRRLAEFRL